MLYHNLNGRKNMEGSARAQVVLPTERPTSHLITTTTYPLYVNTELLINKSRGTFGPLLVEWIAWTTSIWSHWTSVKRKEQMSPWHIFYTSKPSSLWQICSVSFITVVNNAINNVINVFCKNWMTLSFIISYINDIINDIKLSY